MANLVCEVLSWAEIKRFLKQGGPAGRIRSKRASILTSDFGDDLGKDVAEVSTNEYGGSNRRVHLTPWIAISDLVRLECRLYIAEPVRVRSRRSVVSREAGLPVEIAHIREAITARRQGDVPVERSGWPWVGEVVGRPNVGLGEQILLSDVRRLQNTLTNWKRRLDNIVVD